MNEIPREPIDADRLTVASNRLHALIFEGIARAYEAGGAVDPGTARMIAHTLGRALGRSSALAEYGRTGEGSYDALRDEYLMLFNEPTTPALVKEWINWFGTYLVSEQANGSGRRFMNEHLAPMLERVLVHTTLTVEGRPVEAHVPASLDSLQLQELSEQLTSTGLLANPALQAFLSLPDVNAADPTLLKSFEELFVGVFVDVTDAVRNLVELDEWEDELRAFGRERGIEAALSINLRVIEEQTREIYEFVEFEGRVHVFHK